MKTLTKILAVIQAVLLVWSCAVLAEVKKEAGPRAGSFCLVGLGPGDADLLTARAVSMIRAADTVLCDSETRARLAGVIGLEDHCRTEFDIEHGLCGADPSATVENSERAIA